MYDHVLFPTDGSPGTEAAAEHAIDLAEQYRAQLHVLHVVDTSALPLDWHSRKIVSELEEEGIESVQDIARRAETARIEQVVDVVTRGTPYQEILNYISENDIDLVVMGAHGRSGVQRYLLGSVTERIVRLSDIPVLVVPMSDADTT